MKKTIICFGLGLFLYASTAFAGAGATIYGCLYVDTKPYSPVKITMKVGTNNHCVSKNANHAGKSYNLSIKSAGVSCVKIGYIEQKASSSGGDVCATDKSHWHLSYNADSDSFSWSGAADLRLNHPLFGSNHAEFNSKTSGTQLCNSASKCGTDKQQWDSGSVGNLYIVFDPSSS